MTAPSQEYRESFVGAFVTAANSGTRENERAEQRRRQLHRRIAKKIQLMQEAKRKQVDASAYSVSG